MRRPPSLTRDIYWVCQRLARRRRLDDGVRAAQRVLLAYHASPPSDEFIRDLRVAISASLNTTRPWHRPVSRAEAREYDAARRLLRRLDVEGEEGFRALYAWEHDRWNQRRAS